MGFFRAALEAQSEGALFSSLEPLASSIIPSQTSASITTRQEQRVQIFRGQVDLYGQMISAKSYYRGLGSISNNR